MVCSYKHLNNETIVDILMVFFVDIFLFILFLVLGFRVSISYCWKK